MNFVIMDASVVRLNVRNVLEEGLFLVDAEKDIWCSKHQDAKNFPTADEAVNTARTINRTTLKPPRVFGIQQHGMNINITEYKY